MTTNDLTLSLDLILELPENTATDPATLDRAIEWYGRLYGEAACASRAAWDMYSDAIDNEDSREQIEKLFADALTWETRLRKAGYDWNNAKAERLALVN